MPSQALLALLAAGIGAALVVAGITLIYRPAGLIVAGLILLAVGLLVDVGA